MFDNTNFPWIASMSTDLPTVGDLLREAGYYSAYKGKWHLTKEFETVNELGSRPRSSPRRWRPSLRSVVVRPNFPIVRRQAVHWSRDTFLI